MKPNTHSGPFIFALIFVLGISLSYGQQSLNTLHVGTQQDGSILVPSNQLLRPAGSQIYIPGRPVDIVLNSTEEYLVVKNIKSLNLIRLKDQKNLQTLSYEKGGASFTGICMTKDDQKIYLSEGSSQILVARMDQDRKLRWDSAIVMPNPKIGDDPGPGGLALNKQENQLFVTLSRNNSLAKINLRDKSIQEIPVGIAPYEVVLATDHKAYVTNWGGRKPLAGESTYNTSGSLILVDPKTGIANNGSVSVVDLDLGSQTKDIPVGLHPTGMALSPDGRFLAVACANSDQVFVIDTKTDDVKSVISVHR